MSPCNYIPLETAAIDCSGPYLDDFLDLDVLCTEEGIFINAYDDEESELPGTLALDNPSTWEA